MANESDDDSSISGDSSATFSDFTLSHAYSMAENYATGRGSLSLVCRDTAPWPENTYIIRHPDSGLQITLVDGNLRLEHHLGDQGGYHWRCIEMNGWLVFRNPSDRLHIGRDVEGNLVAEELEPDSLEWFVTRAHPDGGHILLAKDGKGLRKVTVGKDGHNLILTKDDGTPWEFVKV
ncbi:hypothetical protein F4677DRAFT_414328 [Hypoxylon crocopeplum]|nr:hypothetical protein F4677DRAFT_414328 [Hypoxylon crocopeplum]